MKKIKEFIENFSKKDIKRIDFLVLITVIMLLVGIFVIIFPANQDYTKNPDAETVVNILNTVDGISDIEIYEINDEMCKTWNYHTVVYFSFDKIPEEEREHMVGTSSEVGTVGGGCIEICNTKDDAGERNAYLYNFDGDETFNAGSHTAIGTIVIRTSCYLTEEQQTNLTNAIEAAFASYTE